MKILVIEDDEVIAELLQSVLAEGGHQATAIASLEELGAVASPEEPGAITSPEEPGPGPYDLVVTDLLSASPYDRGSATRLIAEVRRRVPGVPVIVCTAHHAAAKDCDAMGADAVLIKPFDVEALLGLVDRLARSDTG